MREQGKVPPSLHELLEGYRSARTIPSLSALDEELREVNTVLASEEESIRPLDRFSEPGGVVELAKDLPTVLLPDIHARPGLIWAALNYVLPDSATVLDAILSGSIQFVCLGDYFHGEGRVRQRWRRALSEFGKSFTSHAAMDGEMTESLAVLMMIAKLKSAAPARFHLLKGNHENIANETGAGNRPFGKYAYEGAMVLEYLRMVYTEELIARVYEFEKRLPLLAIGSHFLISHAEPSRFFSREEVIEYRDRDEVIYGLTWTDNDQAEQGAVERMLDHYLDPSAAPTALHFGGHRPVAGRYSLRAAERYVQIHNPSRYIMALLAPDRPVELSRDVIDLGACEDTDDGSSS